MAIDFVLFHTNKNYPVLACCVNTSPWTLVLKQANIDHNHKTLTQSMGEVLEHLIIGGGPKICDSMQVFQWDENRGLFKIDWMLAKKFTRDMPPWTVTNIRWTKIADDLKAFEVLYG
jgi:hypothetical protein